MAGDLNVTVIATGKLDGPKYLPVIYPQMFFKGVHSFASLYGVRVSNVPHMFLYCTNSTGSRIHSNVFAILYPFETSVWIGLIFSVLRLSILLWRTNGIYSLIGSFLYLASSLVAQGRVMSKKKLLWYVSWSLMAFFISIEYTSCIESLLVSPSKESTIKTFKELSKRKYRLVLDSKEGGLMSLMNPSQGLDPFQHLAHMKKLKSTADFIKTRDQKSICDYLARNPRLALMGSEEELDAYLYFLSAFNGRVRCFKGLEKFVTFSMFWYFQSPMRRALNQRLPQLLQSGIYGLLNLIWKQYVYKDFEANMVRSYRKRPMKKIKRKSEPNFLFTL
ncbi:unnamed protein product [Allacma fusca]|uniref:Uncharacterized protein n=1 Tax=Allacma fusca TaxID=39272 RepID=A0A8J2JKU1_9HEXA|nr:unnamed protein product [Allacma fusca]